MHTRLCKMWLLGILFMLVGCASTLPDTVENRHLAMQSSAAVSSFSRGLSVHEATSSLRLDQLAITTGGRTYTAQVRPILTDSTASRTDSTLELTWFEQGVEMRLQFYFTGNRTHWWVDEIRTFNGQDPGNWIYYTGTFFKTPRNHAFTGDVALTSQSEHQRGNEQSAGELHITNLHLECICRFQSAPKKHLP